jgi:hypothetical protein
MKKAVLSLALFAAFSGVAVAAPINAGSAIAVPSIGNALVGVEATNLNQVYFFNMSAPAGNFSASYNSDPVDNTLAGMFYRSNAAGDLLGSALASFGSAVNGNIVLSYGAITAGYYAFKFTSSGSSGYSGQFSARVPAPAALGLAGLGLVGLGLFSRRRAV